MENKDVYKRQAFTRVLAELEELQKLGLCQNGDFLMNSTQNIKEVLRGAAVMCSTSYVDYSVHFLNTIADRNGVMSITVNKDGDRITAVSYTHLAAGG